MKNSVIIENSGYIYTVFHLPFRLICTIADDQTQLHYKIIIVLYVDTFSSCDTNLWCFRSWNDVNYNATFYTWYIHIKLRCSPKKNKKYWTVVGPSVSLACSLVFFIFFWQSSRDRIYVFLIGFSYQLGVEPYLFIQQSNRPYSLFAMKGEKKGNYLLRKNNS